MAVNEVIQLIPGLYRMLIIIMRRIPSSLCPVRIMKMAPTEKTVEVDYTTKDVAYEAVIRNDGSAMWGIMFHRIERLPIYPHNH